MHSKKITASLAFGYWKQGTGSDISVTSPTPLKLTWLQIGKVLCGLGMGSHFSFHLNFPASFGVSVLVARNVCQLYFNLISYLSQWALIPVIVNAALPRGQECSAQCNRVHSLLAFRIWCVSVRALIGAGEQSTQGQSLWQEWHCAVLSGCLKENSHVLVIFILSRAALVR